MAHISIALSTNSLTQDSSAFYSAIHRESEDLLKNTIALEKVFTSFLFQLQKSACENKSITNPQNWSWENGSTFLFSVFEIANFSDKDITRLSLVCKKWNAVIHSEAFIRLRFKKIALIDYESFLPFGFSRDEWQFIYKINIIKAAAEKNSHNLKDTSQALSNRIVNLQHNQSVALKQLDDYLNKINHAVSLNLKEAEKNTETNQLLAAFTTIAISIPAGSFYVYWKWGDTFVFKRLILLFRRILC